MYCICQRRHPHAYWLLDPPDLRCTVVPQQTRRGVVVHVLPFGPALAGFEVYPRCRPWYHVPCVWLAQPQYLPVEVLSPCVLPWTAYPPLASFPRPCLWLPFSPAHHPPAELTPYPLILQWRPAEKKQGAVLEEGHSHPDEVVVEWMVMGDGNG